MHRYIAASHGHKPPLHMEEVTSQETNLSPSNGVHLVARW